LFKIVRQNTYQKQHSREVNIFGIFCALGSIFCAVFAALISRLVLISSTLTPFQTTEIRLLSASIFLFLIFKKEFFYLLSNKSLTRKNHSNLML